MKSNFDNYKSSILNSVAHQLFDKNTIFFYELCCLIKCELQE